MTVRTNGPRYYTPYLPRPTGLADAPNAIVRASAAIAAFEEWAYGYQTRNTYRGPTGTIVPKASVNAIRSGYPFNVTSAPQVCAFYVDTRILPGANPMDVRDELRGVLSVHELRHARAWTAEEKAWAAQAAALIGAIADGPTP